MSKKKKKAPEYESFVDELEAAFDGDAAPSPKGKKQKRPPAWHAGQAASAANLPEDDDARWGNVPKGGYPQATEDDYYHLDFFGEMTGPHNSTKPATNFPGVHTPVTVGRVFIQTPDGKLKGPFTVSSTYRDWWDAASEIYPPVDDAMTIPSDRVLFSTTAPKFNGCVFTATDDYLKARFGRTLHSTDRDWLAAHPLATDDGVPMEYMAICIQAMLEPYGMGVSRMRVRRGSLAAGIHLQQFATALGCNPLAMIDHQTSNEDAAKTLGLPAGDVDQLWRFEYHEEPLPGCTIVGEQGFTATQGVSTGAFGGHARYLAPRAKQGDWQVSLQLAPVDQITYDAPIVLPEYVARVGDETLLLSTIKGPDGKAVAEMYQGRYRTLREIAEMKAKSEAAWVKNQGSSSSSTSSAGASSSGATGGQASDDASFRRINDHGGADDEPGLEGADAGAAPAHAGVRAHDLIDEDDEELTYNCTICDTEYPLSHFERGTDICWVCWAMTWTGKRCPECHTIFDDTSAPLFLYHDDAGAQFGVECSNFRCRHEIAIDYLTAGIPTLEALVEFLPDTEGHYVTDYDESDEDIEYDDEVTDEEDLRLIPDVPAGMEDEEEVILP